MKKQASTPQHVAEAAVESDLVKLTLEFESLKKQLEENMTQVEVLEARQESDKLQVSHLWRQRRVLEAHLQNVKDLLSFR